MIVAGESSGDLHGSNLIRAAQQKYPQFQFFGVGGSKMAEAGCRLLFSADELAVMGVLEVLPRLPHLLSRFRQLKRVLSGHERPDLLVLIDFPDFNLRLAKVAKQRGVPVLYYITPKVWAWRKGRIRTIAERSDRLAQIFPFEPALFTPYGVSADYVGNPLLDEFANNRPTGRLRENLGLAADKLLVGLFPGSRNSEINHIFATLIETAQQLLRKKPELQFLMPVAASLSRSDLAARLDASGLSVTLVEENIYDVAQACDAVLTVSGTVTLQLTLADTPHAIIYRVAPLSYAIGKRLINVEHIGLTNIVAGRSVVPEFVQDAAEPEALCQEIVRQLDEQSYREQILDGLQEVRQKLGRAGCSERVADMIAEMTAVNNHEDYCDESTNRQ